MAVVAYLSSFFLRFASLMQETIERKVIVLCTARYPRNPQPSQKQVDAADYIFNRVYDTLQKKLVKMDRIEKNLGKRQILCSTSFW